MKMKKDLVVLKNIAKGITVRKNQYSDSALADINGYKEIYTILVYSHVVEKGLSHKNPKPLFGIKRVRAISVALQDYIKKGGVDPYIIGTGVAAIKTYNEYNSKLGGVSSSELVPIPDVAESIDRTPVHVGVYETSKECFFDKIGASFPELCDARHSVRLYDVKSLPIDAEKLIRCIKLAQKCPSACNRQSVRVKVILDDEKIQRIEEAQGGCTGFGRNSGAMLVITSDIGHYSSSEEKLAMLDAGIFTMNLTYALYEERLGSCILNLALSRDQDRKMRELCPIPKNETYAAMIAVSNIPDHETILVPLSEKRNVEDIVTVI